MKKLNNVLGAFADGATLFPLMALLTLQSGFNGAILLLTTGLAYLICSIFFRIPMPVQPLKSIAIAAITVGATFLEIRLSGFILGLFCIFLMFLNVDALARKVPVALIHQLQLGLGILLIFQGIKSKFDILVFLVAGGMFFSPSIVGIPLLGLLATVGLLMAVFHIQSPKDSLDQLPLSHALSQDLKLRAGMIVSLLLPQIPLTLTNSVLATQNIAQRTFGVRAEKVTIRNLLGSIGFGNVVVALFGGMPFCHGSGGMTAHVRGGSTQAWSTALMGIVLMILSGIQFLKGNAVLIFPERLVSILLVCTGLFHLQLAKPTAAMTSGKIKLIVAAALTILTRNLLVVLVGAIFLEYFFKWININTQERSP